MRNAHIVTGMIVMAGPAVLLALTALRKGEPVPVPILLLSIVASGLAASVWSAYMSRHWRTKLFNQRQPLTAHEIYARYFQDSGLDERVVTRLWQECAKHLRIPAERMLPTDRFDAELAPTDFFDLFGERTDALAWSMHAHAKSLRRSIAFDQVKTIGDLIHKIAEVERAEMTPSESSN